MKRREFVKKATLSSFALLLGTEIVFGAKMLEGYTPVAFLDPDPFTLFKKNKEMIVLKVRRAVRLFVGRLVCLSFIQGHLYFLVWSFNFQDDYKERCRVLSDKLKKYEAGESAAIAAEQRRFEILSKALNDMKLRSLFFLTSLINIRMNFY